MKDPCNGETDRLLIEPKEKKRMNSEKTPTEFAPAERAPAEVIENQRLAVKETCRNEILLDSIPDIALILNKERQIVYCNESLLGALEISDPGLIYGQRPGEALNCVHARKTDGGCGTTEYCGNCGAVLAILTTREKGRKDVRECRITCMKDGYEESMEFRVWTNPIEIQGGKFTIFTVTNISDEKRRRMLERVFFHDIRNTAGILHNLTQLRKEGAEAGGREDFSETVFALSGRILAEIEAQQQLMAAENNELRIRPSTIRSGNFLREIRLVYQGHETARNKTIRIDADVCDVDFTTDPILLERVFGNMLKNALEDAAPGETVTIGCDQPDDRIRIWAHNPGCIPRKIQLQIFQRSFSTKGSDRGMGTYGMKLLSERYLRGKVSFSSSYEHGTIFTAEYPMSLENDAPAPAGGALPPKLPGIKEREEEPMAFSAETMIRLPEIVDRLENEFMKTWEAVRQNEIFDEIEEFADRIKSFGETHTLDMLIEFGGTLMSHARNFDIDGIGSCLEAYPRVVERLRRAHREK